MRRWYVLLAMGMCGLGASPPASAQPSSEAPIRVTLPDCKALPFDLDALREALVLELSDLGGVRFEARYPTPASQAVGMQVDIEARPCEPTARHVKLRARHAPASSMQRVMEIDDLQRSARPRAIALACRELLHAAQRQPPSSDGAPEPPVSTASDRSRHTPQPSAKPSSTTSAVPAVPTGRGLSAPREPERRNEPPEATDRANAAPEASASDTRSIALSLMATGWGFSTTTSAAAGANLGASVPWRKVLSWQMEADLAFSPDRSIRDASGPLGRAGYAFAAASGGLAWHPWRIAAFGARGYAGYAWGDGTSERHGLTGGEAGQAKTCAGSEPVQRHGRVRLSGSNARRAFLVKWEEASA